LNFLPLRFDLAFSIRFFHVVILGPVIEEVFFRRIILHQFLKIYNAIPALLLSALLFTIYHTTPYGLGQIFITGLILGYVFYRTNSLIACILLHSFYNMLLYSTKVNTTFIDDSSLISSFFIFSISILVIYIFVKYINRFQNIRVDNKDKTINFGADQ